MRYEVKIKIIDDNYTDSLIISMVRQGYEVYFTEDNEVCFAIGDDELTEIP